MNRIYLIGIYLAILAIVSCSKNDKQNTNDPNTPTTGIKYPYFIVDQDTFGGIATYNSNKLYGTLVELYATNTGPCMGQPNMFNDHKHKYQEVEIIDTTKLNTKAKLTIQTGSSSIFFTTKGNYLIPTSSSIDPENLGHSNCLSLNTCGHPNEKYYSHETGNFLFGNIEINDDYYYIYVGTFTLNSYNTPLNSSFIGKAYKCTNWGGNGSTYPQTPKSNYNSYSWDTLHPVNITAKFN
jgi:hypothetical protein